MKSFENVWPLLKYEFSGGDNWYPAIIGSKAVYRHMRCIVKWWCFNEILGEFRESHFGHKILRFRSNHLRQHPVMMT